MSRLERILYWTLGLANIVLWTILWLDAKRAWL